MNKLLDALGSDIKPLNVAPSRSERHEQSRGKPFALQHNKLQRPVSAPAHVTTPSTGHRGTHDPVHAQERVQMQLARRCMLWPPRQQAVPKDPHFVRRAWHEKPETKMPPDPPDAGANEAETTEVVTEVPKPQVRQQVPFTAMISQDRRASAHRVVPNDQPAAEVPLLPQNLPGPDALRADKDNEDTPSQQTPENHPKRLARRPASATEPQTLPRYDTLRVDGDDDEKQPQQKPSKRRVRRRPVSSNGSKESTQSGEKHSKLPERHQGSSARRARLAMNPKAVPMYERCEEIQAADDMGLTLEIKSSKKPTRFVDWQPVPAPEPSKFSWELTRLLVPQVKAHQ